MNDPYRNVLLLIPEPFNDAWASLIELCKAVKLFEPLIPSTPHWPILGLTIKAAHTTLSIAVLAAMRQWPDACILGRALFETEILVKWLLESHTEQRIVEYLEEVENEKERLKRKMEAGSSVSAQIMQTLFSAGTFDRPPAGRKRDAAHGSVRNRAQQVNLDRSYDLPYWTMSIFAHSHAVSLSQWHPELIKSASPLVKMFDFKDKGLPSWMVLQSLPMSALDLFQVADHHLKLSLAQCIAATRQAFLDVQAKVHGGVLQARDDVERGELRIEFSDGTAKSYKPKRTARDPVDDLL